MVIAQCSGRADFDTGGLGAVVTRLLPGNPFPAPLYRVQRCPDIRGKLWGVFQVRFLGLRQLVTFLAGRIAPPAAYALGNVNKHGHALASLRIFS